VVKKQRKLAAHLIYSQATLGPPAPKASRAAVARWHGLRIVSFGEYGRKHREHGT
jgi:hypothetical protein